MRVKFLTFVSLVYLSTSAWASETAQMSIGLSGLKISREREVIEPKEGSSEIRNTSAVDLFGIDGRSALPSLELGLSIGKIVVYAYPNAAAGGRELWLGMKVSDETEFGVLAGTNHLAFSPAANLDGKNVKLSSTNRAGLFVNHRIKTAEFDFDLNLTPWYAVLSTNFEDKSFNQNSTEFGVLGDALWVWDIADNLEIGSGLQFGWSKSQQKLGGNDLQTINWSNVSLMLAETKYSF